MKRLLFPLATLLIAFDLFAQRTLLDDEWQFRLDGETEWRSIDLPHDWSVEGDFDREAPAGNDGGYLPTGRGEYRKLLNCDGKAKHLRLHFEGVYMNAEVRVNGIRVGGHPYGYVPFVTTDIVPYLRRGRKNTIEVTVDNSQQKNCRWYSGSGIYRHVWLEAYGDIALLPHGISIATIEADSRQATVETQVELQNHSSQARKVSVDQVISDLADSPSTCIVLEAGEQRTVTLRQHIPNPRLWSPEHPELYRAAIRITAEGEVTETHLRSFGIRTLSYSATDGFRLNGHPMLVNGACLHHDNGPLGAAAFDAAEIHRVRLMKEAGFNTLRTSHNPPSEAFLSACDSLGMMVIDEAFDGWREAKNAHDYHLLFERWAVEDVQTMVHRDRLHPSVIAWSIGNEIIERKSPQAVRDARRLAEAIREIDPSRPITQALAAWDSDWEIYDSLAAEHDIVGYNYMLHKHAGDHERVPERVIWQTESYPRDAFANWATVADHPYVIGDIVWTGLDYIGESGIGRYFYEGQTPGEHYQRDQWPYHGAYCGDVDITGWRKPISHYRSMLWHTDGEQLYMAVREPDGYHGRIRETQWSVWPTWESWQWPGWEGKPIEVEVISRHPAVRLYLNDSLVGEQSTHRDTQFKAVFSVPYQPGTLKAVALDADRHILDTFLLSTPSQPAALRIVADRTSLRADGRDLAFLVIEVVDAHGHPCPNAANRLTVSVRGSASLEALCNADWRELDTMRDAVHPAWKGRALAVVRAGRKRGKARITVEAEGLRPATLILDATLD